MSLVKNNVISSLNMLLAVCLGGLVGVFFPKFAGNVSGIHGVLSNLLQMCVIPIVVSSLIVEIVSFLKSAQKSGIRKFLGLSVFFSLAFAIMATVFSFVFQPGKQTTFRSESYLNERVIKASIMKRDLDQPIEHKTHQNFFDFFEHAVPKNIFKSFSTNKTFQIILFTIIFAIALSSTAHPGNIESFFRTTYDAFTKIFSFVLLFLPVLVFTSTSLSVSQVGLRVFLDMGPFLKVLFAQLLIIFCINFILLRKLLGVSFFSILRQLETSILVAFSGSVLAATFPALNFFKKMGTQNRQFMTIVAPISMFLNRFGSIMYFCCAAFFIGQVYGHNFTYEQIFFVITLSILGGIASSGSGSSEGITTALLLSILDPINIPSGQLVIVLAGLDFIVMPFLSIITLQTNVTLLSLLLKNNALLFSKKIKQK